jgi:hypothetical protein
VTELQKCHTQATFCLIETAFGPVYWNLSPRKGMQPRPIAYMALALVADDTPRQTPMICVYHRIMPGSGTAKRALGSVIVRSRA